MLVDAAAPGLPAEMWTSVASFLSLDGLCAFARAARFTAAVARDPAVRAAVVERSLDYRDRVCMFHRAWERNDTALVETLKRVPNLTDDVACAMLFNNQLFGWGEPVRDGERLFATLTGCDPTALDTADVRWFRAPRGTHRANPAALVWWAARLVMNHQDWALALNDRLAAERLPLTAPGEGLDFWSAGVEYVLAYSVEHPAEWSELDQLETRGGGGGNLLAAPNCAPCILRLWYCNHLGTHEDEMEEFFEEHGERIGWTGETPAHTSFLEELLDFSETTVARIRHALHLDGVTKAFLSALCRPPSTDDEPTLFHLALTRTMETSPQPPPPRSCQRDRRDENFRALVQEVATAAPEFFAAAAGRGVETPSESD
jgi:hypothetical protein